MTTNHTQTLLDFAGRLDWNTNMEEAPKDGSYIYIMWKDGVIPDVVQWNKTFSMWLPCDCDDDTFSKSENEEENQDILDVYKHQQGREIKWMPIPTGNAGAVIRELVEALISADEIISELRGQAMLEAVFTGYDKSVDEEVNNLLNRLPDIQQAFAKAAALVKGEV